MGMAISSTSRVTGLAASIDAIQRAQLTYQEAAVKQALQQLPKPVGNLGNNVDVMA